MSFHTSADGVSRKCTAQKGKCPLGGDHYDTKVEADKAFEEKMEAKGWTKISKKKPTLPQVRKELQKVSDRVAVTKKALRTSKNDLLEAAKNEDLVTIKTVNKTITSLEDTLSISTAEEKRLKKEITDRTASRTRKATPTSEMSIYTHAYGGCGGGGERC